MKPYKVTKHAVEQAVDRFGWEDAELRIKHLMQTAVYQGDVKGGKVYDHYNTRTRMILDSKRERVITVYSMDSVKPPKSYDHPTLSSAIAATVKRELAKAAREFKRQQRAITAEIAALHFELADALAKQARVYHPPTIEKIQRKADAINAKIHRKQSEIAEAEAEFAKLQTDAQRFVATE